MCLGGKNELLQKVQVIQKNIQAQIVRLQAQEVLLMVAPLLLAPLIAGGALTSVYHVGKAVETSRYWSEYRRNTGRAPRYPFRVGRYDYLRNVGGSMAVLGFARGFGGYVPSRMPNDLMNMYR